MSVTALSGALQDYLRAIYCLEREACDAIDGSKHFLHLRATGHDIRMGVSFPQGLAQRTIFFAQFADVQFLVHDHPHLGSEMAETSSLAPVFIASTAVSTVPNAVITTTGNEDSAASPLAGIPSRSCLAALDL